MYAMRQTCIVFIMRVQEQEGPAYILFAQRCVCTGVVLNMRVCMFVVGSEGSLCGWSPQVVGGRISLKSYENSLQMSKYYPV